MTIKDLYQQILSALVNLYPEPEAKNITYLIFNFIFNYNRYQVHQNFDTSVKKTEYDKIRNIVDELKLYKPIQYIFNETVFYNCIIKVSEDVLIPRPETEELVHWIIKDSFKKESRILDIGTGSGCIAIALAKNIPDSTITATDISEKTLETAQYNATHNNVEVKLYQADIFHMPEDFPPGKFDILVSNPPYVRESEKIYIKPNVLKWEPPLSLFVPDNKPLIYYNTIIPFANKVLESKGQIFLEINENFSKEIKNILADYSFTSIEIRKDLSGKYRMAKAVKA